MTTFTVPRTTVVPVPTAGDPILAERVRRALAAAVPEIRRGRIEIAGIAVSRRLSGRPLAKVAIRSHDPAQSHEAAKAACIGPHGERARHVARTAGVRLDLVTWDPDLPRFVAAALAPARIRAVTIQADPSGRSGRVGLRVVAADGGQAALAIGSRGASVEAAVGLIRIAHPIARRGITRLDITTAARRPEADFEREWE